MTHVFIGAAAVVAAVLALRGAYAVWRGAGGTALATLEAANRVLERRVQELSTEVAALRADNAVLSAKTDFAMALSPIMAWAESHERNAEKRSEAMLNLMGLLADKLGPDANGDAG